jgi:hypothetical protein
MAVVVFGNFVELGALELQMWSALGTLVVPDKTAALDMPLGLGRPPECNWPSAHRLLVGIWQMSAHVVGSTGTM